MKEFGPVRTCSVHYYYYYYYLLIHFMPRAPQQSKILSFWICSVKSHRLNLTTHHLV